MRRWARVALAIALAIAAPWSGSPAVGDEGIRIGVTQVDVSAFPQVRIVAAVTDAQGKPVRGLTAADLTINEGGTPLEATVELASRASPVALALVLDTSGSMGGRPLADAKAAMISLIQALGPADQAAVITFAVDVRVVQGLTGDKTALIAATNGASAAGDTAIYDALSAAETVLRPATGARRAIVLLTDGIDNSSRLSRANVLGAIAGAALPAYVIGLGTDLDRPALTSIAGGVPGGRFLEAPRSADLAAIYATLSEQILTQYTLTYRSTSTGIDDAGVSAELALSRSGALLAKTPVSFRIPAGHGRVPAPAAPVAPIVATPERQAQPQAAAVPVARVPRIAPELVGLLGAASVLTLLLWVSEVASRFPSRQRRRLEYFVRGLALTSPEHAKRRSIVQRIVVPSLRSAGRPLLRITPVGLVAATRQRLQSAGEPLGLGAVEFLGVRAGMAMLGAIIGLGTVTTLTSEPGAYPLGALAGLLLGYAAPGVVIDRLAAKRKGLIRRALPAALDMLALSSEAGLSFDGAIGQVAHRWNTPLSDELRRLLVEFQMGRDRRESLRELAQRTGVPELSRFAGAVIQADSLGVPLSRVLHEQSAEMRIRRRQQAEESAQKAPVKMLFPMVFFIFPALFVVVLGPAVPRLLSAFSAFN